MINSVGVKVREDKYSIDFPTEPHDKTSKIRKYFIMYLLNCITSDHGRKISEVRSWTEDIRSHFTDGSRYQKSYHGRKISEIISWTEDIGN